MVLPFKEPGAARALLARDPYYARVRGEVGRALIKLERALRDSHGKAAPESINSFEFANESISWISGYENEAAVDDASRQIVRYSAPRGIRLRRLVRNGEREHYRYLVGCKPEWCFLYNQNKWYAIDRSSSTRYTTQAGARVGCSADQPRSAADDAAAAEHGFRSGVGRAGA